MPLRAATIGVAFFASTVAAIMGSGLRPHSTAQTSQTASDPAANAAFYTSRVQPILQTNCYRCHGGLNHRGGLMLDSPAGLMKGGHDGVVIVPGHPEQSLLIKLIRHEGPPNDPMPMPPKAKLSDADIATVEQWVRAGAVLPADSAANR